MNLPAAQTRTLWQYSVLTYLLLLMNSAAFLREVDYSGPLTTTYVAAVYLTYCLMYLLPGAAVVFGVNWLLDIPRVAGALRLSPRAKTVMVYTLAVVLFSAVQILIFADRFIFHLYRFHLNGFVWNLLSTRGGIDSLGSSGATQVSFAMILSGIVVAQILLLFAVVRLHLVRRTLSPFCSRRAIIVSALIALLLAGFERVTYGVSSLRNYGPVLTASDKFPFYMPITFNGLARRMGYKAEREPSMKVDMASARVRYPLKPILREPVTRPPNIVWLVSESLRYDMLDAKIMPGTFQFAQKAQWFREHYSGGNGTRMGMFGMFYGLYGNYWFPFMAERRSPVIIDTLMDMNYQMKMFTSAAFTYPEFDKTIFSRIPGELLHEGNAQPKWRRDVENVDLLLDFIDKRSPDRPFMTFMFFDGPHANYYFPKEAVIAEPYTADLNYATMDLTKDIQLIKNRYINACHQLDTQWARILAYLAEHNLLDSTIVVLTGDHGEEFMEKGNWGHNSEYTEEQTRPPLVLWVPGQAPREVRTMTSHLDLPATILPFLGVKNPPGDYSLGRSLLDGPPRDFTIVSDWDTVCFVGQDSKAVFPLKGYRFAQQKITTRNDVKVEDRSAFYTQNKERIVQVMKEVTRFAR